MSDVQSVVVGDDMIVNGENGFTVRLDPGDLRQQTLETLVKKILLQRRRDILEILSLLSQQCVEFSEELETIKDLKVCTFSAHQTINNNHRSHQLFPPRKYFSLKSETKITISDKNIS